MLTVGSDHARKASDDTGTASSRHTVMLVLPWSAKLKGGVSTVVRNLVSSLASQGHNAEYVISDWRASHWRYDAEAEARFRFAILNPTSPIALIKSLLFASARLWRLKQTLDERLIDVVNFHYPGTNALGVALLKQLGLYHGKLVLSFHGTDVRPPAGGLESAAWRILLANTDQITTCSRALAARLSAELTIPEDRIHVLLNGFDRNVFRPDGSPTDEKTWNVSLPARYIASIGSFIPRKGHASLLEAFVRIAASHLDIHLVICGMDGPERAQLNARAATLGLSARVHLFPNLDARDVAHIMRNCTMVVQPSLAEPFGLALLEAGACGAAVVASAVGGHREILTDGTTGLLFPAKDVQALCRQIERLLQNPQETARLANALHQKVWETYSWERCARDLVRIIDERENEQGMAE